MITTTTHRLLYRTKSLHDAYQYVRLMQHWLPRLTTAGGKQNVKLSELGALLDQYSFSAAHLN